MLNLNVTKHEQPLLCSGVSSAAQATIHSEEDSRSVIELPTTFHLNPLALFLDSEGPGSPLPAQVFGFHYRN